MPANRIVIVDDHPLFRDALNHALSAAFESVEILEAGSFDEIAAMLADDSEVDLVLLDLAMPGVQGFSGLVFLRAQHPEIPVVIVSASEDPDTIWRAIAFGAAGYIPKSLPAKEIRSAVSRILNGEVWTPGDIRLAGAADPQTSELVSRLATLTPQQVRVLMMLGEGLLNKQIAYKLNISEATIKAHVSAILQKLAVDSRTQAVIAINRLANGTWKKIVT
jgi:DNA-binding NarL/FixJ family response regulator